MVGKIIVYSPETGNGKIITPDYHKIKFYIDEWNDYENMPVIGQEVEFEQFEEYAHNIHPSKVDLQFKQSKSSESKDREQNSSSTNRKDKKAKEKSEQPKIKVTVDIQKCLESHFSEIIYKVEDCEELLESNKSLDYVKIRRFLLTAYNNLIEIDYSFENNELLEAKQELQNAFSLYLYFKGETEILKKAYEKIFLSKQTEYKELYNKMEFNKSEISILKSKVKTLETTINEKNEKLSKMSQRSEEYRELLTEIKHLKGTMVDAIHKAGKLTEENQLYFDMLDDFYETNFEIFKDEFQEFIEYYKPKLEKIQNVLAYQFDTLIWEKANRSKAIKRFFHQAGIVEEFSSITFLKYFIRTLDEKKLSKKNKTLMNLLEYLESQKKNIILYLDDDLEFLNTIKETVCTMDRDTSIITTSQPGEAIKNIKKGYLNMLILNPKIKRANIEQLINFAREKIANIKIAFISNNIDYELLTLAKKFDITAILHKTVQENELKNQIKQFIDDEVKL